MRYRQLAAVFLTTLTLVCDSVLADVLFLNHGGRVEGELLNRDESPRRSYLVKTLEGGKLTLAPSQVERVVVKSDAERNYEKFASKLADTSTAHWDAAEKCAKAGLTEQKLFHLEQVLRLDPDHEMARHALGYSRIDGKWTRQAEAMESKGYVRAGGSWRLPQELELENVAAELEQKGIKWRKDLKTWREWIIKGRDPLKVSAAEQSIHAIRDPFAIAPLIEVLTRDKEPPALRLVYIDVLGQIGGPEVLATLVRLAIQDPDAKVRERCLDILAKAQSKAAVRQFIKFLGHDDNPIVLRAAVALDRMKDPEATPALIDALITTHKFVEGSSGIAPSFSSDGSGGGGGGLSVGGGQKVIKRKLNNEPVLRTLTALNPGVNFNFDQIRWKEWYKAQHKPKTIVSLRRGE